MLAKFLNDKKLIFAANLLGSFPSIFYLKFRMQFTYFSIYRLYEEGKDYKGEIC
ncbi:PIN family toxin-antitoxin system [Fusobacterium vincentii]|nr:PIN family toxin-antitoxin system [Fusobacterium vincentii]